MNKKLILCVALAGLFSNAYAQQENLIPEVTIASKTNQKINRTGRNTTLITAKDLENYKGKTLPDVLNQVSGFQITNNFSNNAEPKTLRVRGGDNRNVVILVDGVPLQDVTTTSGNLTDIRLLALENIESIEVLNGASSVLYGANATTAVIDIKTKKHSQKEIDAIAGLRVGSYGTFAQKLDISGKSNVFHYQISGANEKSDGISAIYGDDEKDGFEKQNISIKLGVDLEKFNFNILGGWNHHLYDYDNAWDSSNIKRGNDTQTFAGFNANYLYKIGKISFNTRYSEHSRKYDQIVNGQFAYEYAYLGKNAFTEIYNDLTLGKHLGITTGIQYQDHRLGYQNGVNLTPSINTEDTQISHFDAFANLRFNYEFFNIEGGTRMTQHSKFGNHWVYNINPYLYHESGEWFGKVGYTIGTAFIAPNLFQIYGTGGLYPRANFNVKPETNFSQEINISAGKQDRSFVVNASIFHRKEKNKIDYVTVDFITFAGIYDNIEGELSTQGFEAGLDYQITPFLKLGGNFSFVERKNVEQKNFLRQPKQRANSYAEITPFKNTRISISHTYVGKRFDLGNVKLNDFNLFNVGINHTFNKHFSAYFHLNNVLNKDYIDVSGYTTKNRNFTLGVDYKF